MLKLSILALSLALLMAGPASSLSLGGFSCITNNSAADCAIGEAQLSADLTGNVLTITMNGAAAAVVEQIFIEGGATGGTFLGSSEGGIVAFGNAQSGGNLPGGNPVGFVTAINFAAASPAPRKGIGTHNQDPVTLQAGQFALQGDLSALRIGVHMIGLRSGGSESLVTGPTIPEPTSALLFGLGAGIVGLWVRRAVTA